jgi:hypothetical protein
MTSEYVAFSGGIDSTALALLMPEVEPIFTDTGWEFPHVYEHIDRFEEVTRRKVRRLKNPEYLGGIPEYIKIHRFMPNPNARWCTRIFKIELLEKILEDGDILNIALRADEPERSGNWADYARYPLREKGMTRLDCVKLCVEHGLLPRYPIYAARGGCKGCFYKRKSEVQAMAVLIPEDLDELRELEESVQDVRGKYFSMFHNGISIASIQAQPLLFDTDQVYASASDTSDYGQACGLFCNR